MAKFNISTIINKPLEIVWDAYIDPQNMLHWTRFLEKVEKIEGEFGEIGARAHLHYLEKGRAYILEDKLLEFEEKRRILSQVSGQGMDIKVETILEDLSTETKISMNWNGTSKSIFMRTIMNLMIKKITRQAEEELIHFKQLVENHGAKFPPKLK